MIFHKYSKVGPNNALYLNIRYLYTTDTSHFWNSDPLHAAVRTWPVPSAPAGALTSSTAVFAHSLVTELLMLQLEPPPDASHVSHVKTKSSSSSSSPTASRHPRLWTILPLPGTLALRKAKRQSEDERSEAREKTYPPNPVSERNHCVAAGEVFKSTPKKPEVLLSTQENCGLADKLTVYCAPSVKVAVQSASARDATVAARKKEAREILNMLVLEFG
ncbi:hypothetical protein FB45DRAFT_901819 [Roridomyces roridus]|uniref:Uncharacterized protein n=1 Tax=Roridomyces roridus TaxID=1738132 RepID=A0AAD7C8Z3_9AGAR|nr:hypothetical protein FB45DRAFT_901819 [Roridomyces roridus]